MIEKDGHKIPVKLFKFPSRNRPDRFFTSLDSIYSNVSDKDYFHVSCTLDLDDLTMNNKAVIDRINSYPNISIAWGKSKSKIDAVNRDMPANIEWDILINMSDDMVLTTFGFDIMMAVDMLNHFPNLDGLLHYPDQDAKDALATLYVAGRKWWEFRGKNIYHPSYKSLWCDNEEQLAAKTCGKYLYLGYPLVLHLNPAYGHLPKDEMFERQQSDWNHDEEIFKQRRAIHFDLPEPYKVDQTLLF